jgi:hypothetical protein
MVEPALYRAQHQVPDEPGRAVNQMRPVTEAVFKFTFMA